MQGVRQSDPPQPVRLDPDTVTIEARHDAVHAIHVPGQHNVGQQRVSAGDGRHLVPPSAMRGGHLAAMIGALQLVDRLLQGAQLRSPAKMSLRSGGK
jgi:hypothetical protein